MVKILKCAVLLIFYINRSLVSSVSPQKGTTQIDLITQGLAEQEWTKHEEKCLHDTLLLLKNVKNHTLWATWIWNTNQLPVGTFYGSRYSLGNYDQCLKAPSLYSNPRMRTQYCLANVKLTADKGHKNDRKIDSFGAVEDFLSFKTKNGRMLNRIIWGTCLPATCKPESISKILKVIYLINPIASIEPDINVDECQVSDEKTVYSRPFYIFLTVTASLVVAAIISTIYLQYTNAETILTKIADSFSLKRNWSSFIRISGDEIPVLSFTKSVHVVVCTVTHSAMFTLIAGVSNGADVDYLMSVKDNMLGNVTHHLDLIVENFFVMSGLLLIKHLMENKKKPVIALIQRYIRLIVPFAFVVFYCIAVSKYTGDGPIWNKLIGGEQKACEENWIWSLLMLNNYIKGDGICRFIAWYLPCDYHFAILGTGLYFIWNWNMRVAKMTTITATILAVVLPGVVTYQQQISGIVLYDMEAMMDYRKNIVYLTTYIPSHHRFGPYLIGMAMGYILTKYKPAKHRGIISKTLSYIGYAVSWYIGLKTWTGAGPWCLQGDIWNTTIYAAFNRHIWALASCVSIGITEYGDVPEIRMIMAWPGFVIISRLAYGVYIIHSLIFERNLYLMRNPWHFDIFTSVTNGLGVFTLSAAFAILLWLFVEAPLSNLTNLIIDPKIQVQGTANGKKRDTE